MFFGGQGRVRLGVISTCSGMQMCDIYSMSVCFYWPFSLSLWYYWFSGSTKLSTAARGLPLEIADTWAGSASSPKTSGVWKVCVRAVLLPDLPKRRNGLFNNTFQGLVFNYELDIKKYIRVFMYRKIPLISPGLMHLHKGFWGGLYPGGL